MTQQVVMKPPMRPQPTQTGKTVSIKGEAYNALNLQGKAYAPVHQRVESAQKHGGYTVISCEFKEIFDMRVCEVWIEIEGKRYPGTAELKDKKDFARPLEDAQTSAIGRALAFAGYNIETAIASAEDMSHVMQAQGATIVESAPTTGAQVLVQQEQPALDVIQTRANDLRERAARIGWIGAAYTNLVLEATGKTKEQLAKQGKPTGTDLDKLEKRVILLEKAAKAEAEKADGVPVKVVDAEPEQEPAVA